jgi:NADH-quinone oxidoreductase subunit M
MKTFAYYNPIRDLEHLLLVQAIAEAQHLLGAHGFSPHKEYREFFQLSDLSVGELATVIPLAPLILWIGLYPGPFMVVIDASVINLVQHMDHYRMGK